MSKKNSKNSNVVPKIDYHKELKNKASVLLDTLRTIFRGIDNKVYNSLDDVFKEEVLMLIGMIPENWCSGLYDSVTLAWDIILSVDFTKLAKAVTNHNKARLWFSIDSYDVFYYNCVVKNEDISDNAKKATKNILDRIRPIFDAINILIKKPDLILAKTSLIYGDFNNKHNNILENI